MSSWGYRVGAVGGGGGGGPMVNFPFILPFANSP